MENQDADEVTACQDCGGLDPSCTLCRPPPVDPEVLAAAQAAADQRFLCDKVARNNLVRVRVLDAAGPQSVRASVERIYSTGNEIDPSWQGAEIEFVCGSSTWGNEPLKIGDRAFVFVSTISGRLYEDSWRGHLVIEDIEGVPHAIFQARDLWASKHLPEEIRGSGRQDPRRSYASAFRFDAMEAYLMKLIAKAQKATP